MSNTVLWIIIVILAFPYIFSFFKGFYGAQKAELESELTEDTTEGVHLLHLQGEPALVFATKQEADDYALRHFAYNGDKDVN